MSSIVSQTDIDKLLAENPYLQFGGVQQQPTSLIQNMMASVPGWISGSTPEAQAPTSYIMTENFPGMEPRNIAEYQIAPGASNTANLMSAGKYEGPSFEQTSTIADTLYKDGKFADKDYTSELQTLSGGGSTISNQAWRGFLDSLNYVEEQQLKQYLTGKGVADTTPYLSYDESRIPESVLSSLKSAGMGSLGDAMAQYGTSGKKGQAIAPGVQGPFSPWMSDEERSAISDSISKWNTAYTMMMNDRRDHWYDSPLSIAAAPMMMVSEEIGNLVSQLPNLAKLLVSPSMSLYGGVKESRGIIDSLENIIMPLVSSYYTGSPGPGLMQAGAHNLARKASTGEDKDWEEAASDIGTSAGLTSMVAGPVSAAGSGLSNALMESGVSQGTSRLITSLGKNIFTMLPKIISAVSGSQSSEALPATSQIGASSKTGSTATANANTIAESLSNSTGANAGIANILEQLAVMNAARGGGNIKRMLRLAGIE